MPRNWISYQSFMVYHISYQLFPQLRKWNDAGTYMQNSIYLRIREPRNISCSWLLHWWFHLFPAFVAVNLVAIGIPHVLAFSSIWFDLNVHGMFRSICSSITASLHTHYTRQLVLFHAVSRAQWSSFARSVLSGCRFIWNKGIILVTTCRAWLLDPFK